MPAMVAFVRELPERPRPRIDYGSVPAHCVRDLAADPAQTGFAAGVANGRVTALLTVPSRVLAASTAWVRAARCDPGGLGASLGRRVIALRNHE